LALLGACSVPQSVHYQEGEITPVKTMPKANQVVRVLVVDDHEPFRNFVGATLQARPELQVIGEASDGLEAVQKAEELRPDLILLDIGLPTLNGIEVSHRISRLVPSASVLFLSQENDADLVATALSNGARGYVLKLDAGQELLLAVESVLRGQRFTSTGVTPPHTTPPRELTCL